METAKVERALAAIGGAFRLSRLYRPAHPAVVESLHQVTAALPPLAALGTVEWKVGATGFHWHSVHVLPRNTQLAELAGLLYVRGVRSVQLHPGASAENVLALFEVATGKSPLDEVALGHISLTLGRRLTQRLSAAESPPPAVPPVSQGEPDAPAAPSVPAPAAPAPAAPVPSGRRSSAVFRPDALPVDIEAKRTVVACQSAETADARRSALARLAALAPELHALRDLTTMAEIIAALDAMVSTVQEPDVLEAIGTAAAALADKPLVERLVRRLGEPRVPPAEREALLAAVAALAAVSVPLVLDAYPGAPADQREPFRAAIRRAADRAVEPLQARLESADAVAVGTVAEFLGLTGSPQALLLLTPLLRHGTDLVREAALLALAEIGGREVVRPAMPALKDESAPVRIAAARAVGVGGEPSATTVLVRRLDQEQDEGVLAELLRAIGRLGGKEALEVLAKHAEPGGMLHRRNPAVRAAAIEGLAHLSVPEARALLELYSQDKEPIVRQAAGAGLR